MHQALYRKWRPATFDEVVGQRHITDVLRYEVESGRVTHAYLFCGSRGTGKTTCAKILAKAANCLSPVHGNPCGECENCRLIESGAATDLLEMDAASNTGVDNIRDIRDEVVYAPTALKSRVYIIDEVHMLTDSAFNALLKTLEEPPQNVIFILATTEMQKIPATILSRCQSFEFRRLPSDVIASRLQYIAGQEGAELEEEAAFRIARLSAGGMRDAISLLELCMADGSAVTAAKVIEISGSGGRETVAETVRAIIRRDSAALFDIIAKLYRSAKDVATFWQELMAFYRDMMVLKASSRTDPEKLRREILDLTESEMATLRELADQLRYETMLYHVRLLDEAYTNTISRGGDNKRLCAEMTLLRMTAERLDASPEALLHRISALEDALLTGQIPASVRQQPAPAAPARTAEAPTAPAAPAPEQPSAPAPQAKEVGDWQEIAAVFKRANPSASSFLGEDGAWIDEKSVAHVRVRGGFSHQMLSQRECVDSLRNLISAGEGRPLTDLVFEVLPVRQEQQAPPPADDIF